MDNTYNLDVRRGDIWYIEPNKKEKDGSSVQSGTRPGIIVSNDVNNTHSSTVNVVYLTNAEKKPLPTHVQIGPSTALCEQITTVGKDQLLGFKRHCTEKEMLRINAAILVQLGIIA